VASIDINDKSYKLPEEDELELGDFEVIQEMFGGEMPDLEDPKTMRNVKFTMSLIRIAVQRAGDEITMDELRHVKMAALAQKPEAAAELPPPVPASDSQPVAEPDATVETPIDLGTLRAAAGHQS
jgi:hypothetical protein